MRRDQLAHLLRAACRISGDSRVLVLGSQSILGAYGEEILPADATASMEADIAFLDDQDRRKADSVEGAIGEMSGFHEQFGVYAEGVHVETAAYLPAGWRGRLTTWELRASEPAEPLFLEPHDLAVSKLGAGRPKDFLFVDALIRAGLLDVPTLMERAALLAPEHSVVANRIERHLDAYARGTTSD